MKKTTPQAKKINYRLNELNKLFVQEIMDGKFTVKDVNEHLIDIVLTANIYWRFSIFYYSAEGLTILNAGENTLRLTFTEEQKQILFDRFTAIYKNDRDRPEKVEARKAEFLKLKNEFEPVPAAPIKS